MHASIYQKLEHLNARYHRLGDQLSEPTIIADRNQFRKLSKERAQIESIVDCFEQYKQNESAIVSTKSMLTDDNAELRALAKEELTDLQARQEALFQSLRILLLPQDPNDERDIFLEIRAGAGGDEAAIFVGDLLRMYGRYAETKGWSVKVMNSHESERGGYKVVVVQISGQSVYSQLKFESGTHRVQRVPTTESQGRIHTSTCTVAVLPELEAIDNVDIQASDLRIDTFRASGAGGQHVNKTDSAVRITHKPTNIVVECQDERSQHKNRARAMKLLQAKLLNAEQAKQRQARAATRRDLVGSGDRSERIRTYNYPQLRVTDHRIGLTLHQLNEILSGEALDQVIQPLVRAHQADLLATLGDESFD